MGREGNFRVRVGERMILSRVGHFFFFEFRLIERGGWAEKKILREGWGEG